MSDDSTVVLLVEDDPNIVDLVQANLLARGFRVVVSRTGDHVTSLVRDSGADLVLLDLMLPGRGGLEIRETLRKSQMQTPVLSLKARDTIEDRVLRPVDYLPTI